MWKVAWEHACKTREWRFNQSNGERERELFGSFPVLLDGGIFGITSFVFIDFFPSHYFRFLFFSYQTLLHGFVHLFFFFSLTNICNFQHILTDRVIVRISKNLIGNHIKILLLPEILFVGKNSDFFVVVNNHMLPICFRRRKKDRYKS